MVWAKVVDNEIMQLHDEDPAGHWHPDALEFWQEVPDNVHIGWKLKNGEWISGGQWLEEFMAENPPPPPGPPTPRLGFSLTENREAKTITVEFHAATTEVDGEFVVTVGDKTFENESIFTVTFDQTDAPQEIACSITATGPGGTATVTLEGDDALIIPEKFLLPMERLLAQQGK